MWRMKGNRLLCLPGPCEILYELTNQLPGGVVVDFTQDVCTAPVIRGKVTASHQQVHKGSLTHRYFSCNYIKIIGRKKIYKKLE